MSLKENEEKSLEEKLYLDAVAEKIRRLKNNLFNLFGDNISDDFLDAYFLAKIEENKGKMIMEALTHFTTRDLFAARELIKPKSVSNNGNRGSAKPGPGSGPIRIK